MKSNRCLTRLSKKHPFCRKRQKSLSLICIEKFPNGTILNTQMDFRLRKDKPTNFKPPLCDLSQKCHNFLRLIVGLLWNPSWKQGRLTIVVAQRRYRQLQGRYDKVPTDTRNRKWTSKLETTGKLVNQNRRFQRSPTAYNSGRPKTVRRQETSKSLVTRLKQVLKSPSDAAVCTWVTSELCP